MKKKMIVGLVGIVVAVGGLIGAGIGLKCLEIVPEGHVAVVYSLQGGTQEEVLTQGLNFISPFEKTKNFTIAQEQLILSADTREGSKEDESFVVSTSDNANMRISFQMSYRFKQDKVSETYNNFRGMDGRDIINSRVRTVLKSKISEVTSKYTMMDIYSGNREVINNQFPEHLTKALEPYGIEVLSASIIDVHPDAKLQESIQAKVKAIQDKERAEIEKQQALIEAEKKAIQAKGEADAQIERARGEAEANELINKSLSENLLKQQELEARKLHGWITIQGAEGIITDARNNE